MQPNKKKCDRCGLYYTEGLDKCRWCGDLDEAGLAQLLEKIDRQHQSNKSLGQIFIVLAAIVAVLVMIV